MANTIQVKRGLEANRATVTPAAGEFLYVTDTKSVFVGDGTTAGGNQVGASGAYTEFLNQSTDVTLTLVNVGQVIISPTVSIMVQLPNATTLKQGDTFAITNMSQQDNIFVRSSDGTYQAFVAAGETVNVTVEDISTAAGVWAADNPNYGFSSPVSLGYAGTYANQSINNATAVISATKMIRINSSGPSAVGVTATIITKSGANLTKGTEQYLFNFNVSAGSAQGFINVIMTSATTGIISTIGNDTQTGSRSIFLYTFSINASDVVQITGSTSIPLSLQSVSRAFSLTALSPTSVILTYTAGGPAYSARILTLSSGLITAIGAQSTIFSGGGSVFPQVVALSSTLVVASYFNSSTNDISLKVGSISGTTITWGTAALVRAAATPADLIIAISRLSGTEFIVSFSNGTTILSNYGSVSGTTITLGAQNSYTGGGSLLYSITSYPISSTSALVVHYDSTTANNKPYAFVLTKSGTALTRGTVYTLATSPTPTTVAGPFSLKGFVAFDPIQQPATDLYMDYATDSLIFALPLSVSGTVVTAGTGLLVTPENVYFAAPSAPAICTLSKTRAIAFVYYYASPDGTPGSRLYLLDTSGARPVIIATSSTISTATVFCAGQLTATRAIIAYSTSPNALATIRTLDITGDTFTFNTAITGTCNIGYRPAVRKINPTKAMIYVASASNAHRIYNIAISGTTVTESPSFLTLNDNANQSYTSARALYNFGDIGYFYQLVTGVGNIVTFNVSGASPTDLTVNNTSINSSNSISYSSVIAPGTFSALAADSTVYGSFVYAGVDAYPRVYSSVCPPDIYGAGILLPFNQNSIMVCGNNINYYGKIIITPASVAFSENSMLFGRARNFSPFYAMHEPIQDWVDGDYFAPNTSKILFVARSSSRLTVEMYHVFDRGAAQ